MITKSNNILYLFDFDGTLFGLNQWYSFWKNSYMAFKTGPYFNPHDKDIRWSVLTGRPKVDKLLVKVCCNSWGLYPQNIYTLPKMFYGKTNFDEVCGYKLKFMKDAILGRNELLNNKQYDQAFYIDADLNVVSYMNRLKTGFPIMALTIKDFKYENFNIWCSCAKEKTIT